MSRKVAIFGPSKIKSLDGDNIPFEDYALVSKSLSSLIAKDDVLLLGGGRGLDALANKWATENSVSYVTVTPNIALYKEHAFEKRNAEMIADADISVVFWDGKFLSIGVLIANIVVLGKAAVVLPVRQ